VYFRGYDKENDMILGHNSYADHQPIIKVPNGANIEFYKVDVDIIIGLTDPTIFYMKFDKLENSDEKEFDGQNVEGLKSYVG
jgi:hypothetical protein